MKGQINVIVRSHLQPVGIRPIKTVVPARMISAPHRQKQTSTPTYLPSNLKRLPETVTNELLRCSSTGFEAETIQSWRNTVRQSWAMNILGLTRPVISSGRGDLAYMHACHEPSGETRLSVTKWARRRPTCFLIIEEEDVNSQSSL